ncbi:MAG: lipopolysaccharide heptosyltransferase II [Candidatus Omnitrophica bacterium]|nr:lipopolysaccharide heptosyltransferase II [Candidatus Omnitrophota bacterium]
MVRTDRLGDVVLSTPVVKNLRDTFPQSFIAMMVRPYTKDVVEGNPYLDEVILYDKDNREKGWLSTLRFSRVLAKKRFDLAVVLNPSNRSNLIPFLAGIPRRVGYDRKMGFLLTDQIKDVKHEGKKHEIEYNLDLIRVLGIDPRDQSIFMPLTLDSEKWVEEIFSKENILAADKLVAINPGASDNSKMWIPEHYAQVADKLSERGIKVIIIGGPGDKKICQKVIENMHRPYINMVANNNISQAASFLRRCSLFISPDTGLVHIASAVGVPVISLFGRKQPGLSPRRWGPSGKKDAVLHKDVGCSICLANNCKIGFACIKAITPDEVLEAAEKIISVQ